VFDLAGNPLSGPTVKVVNISLVNSDTAIAFVSRNFSFDTTGKSTTGKGWQEESFVFETPAANRVGSLFGLRIFTTNFSSISSDPAVGGPVIDDVRILSVLDPRRYYLL
jgi:hypothetical protein